MARKFSIKLQENIRERAEFLCEYCHTNERWQYVRFTVDHVNPNNGDSIDNLALACFHCNRRKSNKVSFADTGTNETVSIFNPRLHIWKEHFEWSSDKVYILPKTVIGKVTIELLQLNRNRILFIRKADIEVNRHPPNKDLE